MPEPINWLELELECLEIAERGEKVPSSRQELVDISNFIEQGNFITRDAWSRRIALLGAGRERLAELRLRKTSQLATIDDIAGQVNDVTDKQYFQTEFGERRVSKIRYDIERLVEAANAEADKWRARCNLSDHEGTQYAADFKRTREDLKGLAYEHERAKAVVEAARAWGGALGRGVNLFEYETAIGDALDAYDKAGE